MKQLCKAEQFEQKPTPVKGLSGVYSLKRLSEAV